MTADRVYEVGGATVLVVVAALAFGFMLGLIYVAVVAGGGRGDFERRERDAAIAASTAQQLGHLAHRTVPAAQAAQAWDGAAAGRRIWEGGSWEW